MDVFISSWSFVQRNVSLGNMQRFCGDFGHLSHVLAWLDDMGVVLTYDKQQINRNRINRITKALILALPLQGKNYRCRRK